MTTCSIKGGRRSGVMCKATWCLAAMSAALLVLNGAMAIRNDFGFDFNETGSLPNWAFGIDKRVKTLSRGDYIAFVAPPTPYYPKGMVFTKRVYGVGGDVVTVKGRDFYINGRFVGHAKERSQTGRIAVMSEPGVIPPGKYFVGTPHPDSLDSRYKMIGLIDARRVVGKAYPVL